jgi:protein-tyrosine phosphatase
MKNRISNLMFKSLAIILAEVFFVANCSFVFGFDLQNSTLAPNVQLNIINFRDNFNLKYDSSFTKDQIFTQISAQLNKAFQEKQFGHENYEQGLRRNYQNIVLLAINNTVEPRQTALNFLQDDAAGALTELLSLLEYELKLTKTDIARIVRSGVDSNSPKQVFESLSNFAILLANNNQLETDNRARILISLSQKPQAISRRFQRIKESKATRDDFFEFIDAFNKAGFVDGGANIFFLMPKNYKKYLSNQALATLISLDEYVRDYYRREGQDVTQSLIMPYFADNKGKPSLKSVQFSQLRYLVYLAESRGQALLELEKFIAKNKITPSQIMRAYLRNKQNEIISQTSDLILSMNKDSLDKAGLPDNLVPLAEKVGIMSLERKDINKFFGKLGVNLGTQRADELLLENGMRVVNVNKRDIIVPVVFDVILSAYRGSAENDHQEADYITHAISTAIINYATRKGEVKDGESGAYGSSSFHEIDNLLPLIGKDAQQIKQSRVVDTSVSLAYSHNSMSFPDWWRKRTVRLIDKAFNGGSTIADHLEQLQHWQTRERKAKADIYEIFVAMQQGFYNPEELELAIRLLENRLDILRNHCGLKRAYYDALFGSLDSEFFDQLRANYDFSGVANNIPIIRRLLQEGFFRAEDGINKYQGVVRSFYRENGVNTIPYLEKHPWIESEITIIDYLKAEQNILSGTFEDLIKSSINQTLIRRYANNSAEQEKLFIEYESTRNIEKHERNLITDAETGQEILKADIKQELERNDSDLSAERIIRQIRKNKYADGLFRAQEGRVSSTADHTARVMNAYLQFFGKEKLPANVSREMFLTMLLMHDIGKPEAISLSGSRGQQHAYTERVIESLRGLLPFSGQEIDFIKDFVNIDPIGTYLRSSQTGSGNMAASEKDIKELAEKYGLPVDEVFDLILVYYQCDVASRTRLFLTGKAPARSYEGNNFDVLFEYNQAKDNFVYENPTRLQFSRITQSYLKMLEQRIKGNPEKDKAQYGPVLEEEKLTLNSRKDTVTNTFRHEVRLGAELLVVRSEREMPMETKFYEVFQGLFVGNAVAALQHKNLGIDSILNVADEVNFFDLDMDADTDYKKIRLIEGFTNEIAEEDIKTAIEYIDSQLRQGKRVMVNCRAGMARSVSIVLAYLYHANRDLSLTEVKKEFFSHTPSYNIMAHNGLEITLSRMYPRLQPTEMSQGAIKVQESYLNNENRFAVETAI